MFSNVIRRTFSMTTSTSTTKFASSKKPLILIVGATGTGKSDLAIQIAQELSSNSSNGFAGAEIVNADAMQLYHGLPIITNKVSILEQQGIPHHLLGHIGLGEEPWTVQRYVKEADRVLEEIRGRNKIPIVVGGTGYYVYGLLFKNAMIGEAGTDVARTREIEDDTQAVTNSWSVLEASTEEIYAKLQEVDPEQARRWHPKDRRRVQRSLEIYLRSGRKASEIYEEQRQNMSHSIQLESDGEDSDGAGLDVLRYDPLVLWLEAEGGPLKERLNQRVDRMVETGLLAEAIEMNNFLQNAELTDSVPDKTKGIWVSIGYKEMEPWIEASRDRKLPETKLHTLRDSGIEAVKVGTRQYAKRQNRFIRIRLANALSKAQAKQKLYLLDCTDSAQWQDHVQQPALRITSAFLQDEALPNPSGFSPLAKRMLSDQEKSPDRVGRRCTTCAKVLMTEKEWIAHIDSRSHKKILAGIRKREVNRVRMEASRPDSALETPSSPG